MDQATALKILQNQGAPPTPENLNRVMEMSARSGGSRDTELLGRSLGLQGGMGESGPGLDLMLDKIIKSTSNAAPAPIATEAAINPNSESNGAAQNGGARGNGAVAPASPRVMPPPTRPTAHNEAAGNPLQTGNENSALQSLNRLLGANSSTPQTLPGEAEGGGAPPQDSFKGMSAEEIALAMGIPVAAAAVIKASIDAVETTGKKNRIQGIKESVDADNAKMKAALEAGQSPSAAVDAANKVAADTAAPAPKPAPVPTSKPTKAPPRTAVPNVDAGPLPAREATVVDDGVAAAERAKSNAALKPAQKPARVPPAKDVGPIPSIKETYPQHTPIPKEALPQGPVEPQGSMRQMFDDLVQALKKSKIKGIP